MSDWSNSKKRQRKSGWEVDAFTKRYRYYFKWRAGMRKAIKTAANRRFRRELKKDYD